jgi:signal transduction histidine kinase/ketosteroid isomerase-like protein
VQVDFRSLPARYHQAFNDRDFDVWREVFDEDVELVVDGMTLRGVDAAVAYGVRSVTQFPGLHIASECVVAESGDTVVTEIRLVNGDPASGRCRQQGTACEVSRVRYGRIVSCRSYYMAELGGTDDAVRVPARGEAARMAEERAALRRVARLVARGVSQEELFAAVNQEVGWLVGADPTSLMRFERDETVTLLDTWSARHADFPIGANHPMDDVLRSIRDTGRPWRWGPADLPLTGPFVDDARRLGIRAALGVPIVVDGRVWGIAYASSTTEEPFADDAEARIAGFAELVAAAIATAQARLDLSALVEEQAALRRVATLVARGAPPAELFDAVIGAICRLLSADAGTLARYESDDRLATIAFWSSSGEGHVPIGPHRIESGNLAQLVRDSGGPARVDSYAGATGSLAETARDVGWRSSVGAPVIVGGRVWGLVAVASTTDLPLPSDTEQRLAAFTELLATAIANAQSREDLTLLAEEQAALRRVATLVARGAPPSVLFGAVTEEVGRLLDADLAGMIRYLSEDTITAVATWAAEGQHPPVEGTWALEGDRLATAIATTGRASREDDWAAVGGPIAAFVRDQLGIRSSVASPIAVQGRVWGALFVHSTTDELMPPDTESRLMNFTELVATAISNTEARADADRLAEEQAALRRVATLVAHESSPDEVFAAVAEEVGQLLGIEDARMVRYDGDGTATVVASWGQLATALPVGTHIPLEGVSASALVFRSGRAARIDDFTDAPGDFAASLRRLGVRSAVGAPIVVDGELWGAMSTAWLKPEPLPADTEARMREFTELVATAISNTEARADVAASRARIVAAADEERRRVVRDLHDGAQQRLVHTIITLKLARQALESDHAAARAGITEALEHAEQATHELRELSHGIMPAVLTRGGLRAGVLALASRSPVPVDTEVSVGRLPATVEATAYFVVAEALTNVFKHARATGATVTARIEEHTLRLAVRDDGVGGARSEGSGLVGLRDRLAALDGRLRVESPAQGGTLVAANIPLRQ